MTTTAPTQLRELDSRKFDGISVDLLWEPGSPDVFMRVNDARTGAAFTMSVPGADALEAFNHPFAYRG